LEKDTDTAGPNEQISGEKGSDDNFNQVYILGVKHSAGNPAKQVRIENLQLFGDQFSPRLDYHLFAPRLHLCSITDVLCQRAAVDPIRGKQWYMNDFENIEAKGFTGTGISVRPVGGTSNTFTACYAHSQNGDNCFVMEGMSYSTMNGCAAEAVGDQASSTTGKGITLLNCNGMNINMGFENIYGTPIRVQGGGKNTFTGGSGLLNDGADFQAFIEVVGTGRVSFVGCEFRDWESTSGNTQNIRIQDSSAVFVNTLIPSSGSKGNVYDNGGKATFINPGNIRLENGSGTSRQTYNENNVTSDRSFDADNTTVSELGDVIGTLISDLRKLGVIE
jgi:hypothetical protein